MSDAFYIQSHCQLTCACCVTHYASEATHAYTAGMGMIALRCSPTDWRARNGRTLSNQVWHHWEAHCPSYLMVQVPCIMVITNSELKPYFKSSLLVDLESLMLQ